jgi:hypothetical protein
MNGPSSTIACMCVPACVCVCLESELMLTRPVVCNMIISKNITGYARHRHRRYSDPISFTLISLSISFSRICILYHVCCTVRSARLCAHIHIPAPRRGVTLASRVSHSTLLYIHYSVTSHFLRLFYVVLCCWDAAAQCCSESVAAAAVPYCVRYHHMSTCRRVRRAPCAARAPAACRLRAAWRWPSRRGSRRRSRAARPRRAPR